LVAAYIFGMERKAQPPVFKPVSNPYESAIYANGMIESDLPSGENINIFPKFPARSPRCWCRKASR
jgi:HlyD family secretion protein